MNFVKSTGLAVGLGLALGSPMAIAESDRADLTGGQENPPVVSFGGGDFKAKIGRHGIRFQLRYDVPDSGIRQAHLHVANPSVNGPIAVFLCTNLGNTPPGATARTCPDSPGAVEGTIVAGDVLTADNLQATDLEGLVRLIEDGAVYVNVHSEEHPSGELRGQINSRHH
jgi:hypothetical protein